MIKVNFGVKLDNPKHEKYNNIEELFNLSNEKLEDIISISFVAMNLKEIPKKIILLKNLEYVYFDYNYITELPLELFELKKIKHLYFSNNYINYIPKEIEKLVNLKDINCSFNCLQNLPEELFKLSKLEVINCMSNKIYLYPNIKNQKIKIINN